jgi:hypothetical protein
MNDKSLERTTKAGPFMTPLLSPLQERIRHMDKVIN